ncbi:MAG: phosphatidylglycerophosphatase A [Candidatus Omnitrophota bacterium]
MNDSLVKMISTFFYIGRWPAGPGTVASLAGAILAVIFHHNPLVYALVFAVITWAGFKTCGRMEEIEGRKDPGCIVIDEVSGIMIAFFALPLNWAAFWTAFFLFRAFDMFKIYPVGKFEEMGGAKGVMMDDIVAGIYTFVIMQTAVKLAGMI